MVGGTWEEFERGERKKDGNDINTVLMYEILKNMN